MDRSIAGEGDHARALVVDSGCVRDGRCGCFALVAPLSGGRAGGSLYASPQGVPQAAGMAGGEVYFSGGGRQGKADAPRWSNCEFDDAVSYVRHRTTGELSAFVAVTVALEGISHLTTSATDLMSNLQAGTAVFRFDKDHWVTDGRVIHNLSPNEAIRFYQNDWEMVGQEMADRTV